MQASASPADRCRKRTALLLEPAVTTDTQFKASAAMRHNLTFLPPQKINVAPKGRQTSVAGEGDPATESTVCEHSVAYAAKTQAVPLKFDFNVSILRA